MGITKSDIHGVRKTVDDPENDVHDDELAEDDNFMPKEKPEKSNPDKFERPW